jgi:hypothetical protein
MASMFNGANWYWAVAGKSGQVYASARNIYVPLADSAYVAWLAGGNIIGSPIASEAEIWPSVSSVLPAWLFNGITFAQPAVGQYTKAQLAGYNINRREWKVVQNITVNGRPFATDVITLGSLNSAYIYTVTVANSTFAWKLPDGTYVTLAKQDVTKLQGAVSKYGQDCYACEANVATAITAGTTTTLAQIDTAYAAIVTTFTGLEVEDADVEGVDFKPWEPKKIGK